jgi:hypothetical protein
MKRLLLLILIGVSFQATYAGHGQENKEDRTKVAKISDKLSKITSALTRLDKRSVALAALSLALTIVSAAEFNNLDSDSICYCTQCYTGDAAEACYQVAYRCIDFPPC